MNYYHVDQADHEYMVPEPDVRLGHHVGHHVLMVVVGLTYLRSGVTSIVIAAAKRNKGRSRRVALAETSRISIVVQAGQSQAGSAES